MPTSNSIKLLQLLAVSAAFFTGADTVAGMTKSRARENWVAPDHRGCVIRITAAPITRIEVGQESEVRGPRSTFYFEPSSNPAAQWRPIMVLIPGGPGLSHKTLEPLNLLSTQFDLLFVDPPGGGEHRKAHVYDVTSIAKGRFELYDSFIQDFAQQLRENSEQFQGRPLVLVGHSYGGVFAAEVAARHGKELNLAGVVPISSYLTHAAYSETETLRKKLRGADSNYITQQNLVMDLRVGSLFSNIPGPLLPELMDQELASKAEDRNHLIDWALAYGSLVWNDRDEANVRKLLESDRKACSPEMVRFILKNWRADSREGDWTVSQLATQPDLKKLVIAGSDDRLLPLKTQIRQAKQMGADYIVLTGASHFAFTTHLDAIREALVARFGAPPPRSPRKPQ